MSKLVDATLAPFAAALNHWPKAAGTPPTALELQTIMAMNIRAGKHVLACAMYLRADGATDAQVKAAAIKLDTKGGRQGVLHNYRRDLETDGLVRRDMNAPRGVYKITLTKKGEAQVARYLKATAPKGETKPATPRKPRAKRNAALPVAAVEAAADMIASGVPADTVVDAAAAVAADNS